ncbi:MAG: F0F1 ATP synthase subunit gamma, partial [Anaerolineaceae bacterium]|nr:F0F1 ATP synthase subunit gamma [Anaerolineaceae bacterium]
MSETINQTKTRLENIQSVEPVLGALRTIAMGSWKAALNRRVWALEYASRLSSITAQVLPLLTRLQIPPPLVDSSDAGERVIVLVIGSERGLCGAFNRELVEGARRYLTEATRRAEQVRLQV